MKTNLTLSSTDVIVLIVLAVLLVIAVKVIFGFFKDDKKERK
ncbi:hypothetical protein [Gemmiger sp.]